MHRFYSRIITHMAHVFIKVDIHHSLLIATLLHTGNFNSCFNLLIVKDTKIQTNLKKSYQNHLNFLGILQPFNGTRVAYPSLERKIEWGRHRMTVKRSYN